jgi:hypothetical protein
MSLRETRCYHKGHDQFTYERFETAALVENELALRKLVYLLGAERLAPAKGRCQLDDLLADSRKIGLDRATQKIFDRVLLSAFWEDRGLLPAGSAMAGCSRMTNGSGIVKVWSVYFI